VPSQFYQCLMEFLERYNECYVIIEYSWLTCTILIISDEMGCVTCLGLLANISAKTDELYCQVCYNLFRRFNRVVGVNVGCNNVENCVWPDMIQAGRDVNVRLGMITGNNTMVVHYYLHYFILNKLEYYIFNIKFGKATGKKKTPG